MIEKYNKDDYLNIKSMHDECVSDILIKDNNLVIIYDNIDEKIYKYKKLTITYELDSYCDVLMFYKNNKYLFIDMISNYEKFKKLINKSQYRTYKYFISNFKEIELELTSILKSKYYSLRILLDPITITYHYE